MASRLNEQWCDRHRVHVIDDSPSLSPSASEFTKALEAFESEMDPSGPYFFGDKLGWVDILIAPCGHPSHFIYRPSTEY
jgi:glutathione S-transferase